MTDTPKPEPEAQASDLGAAILQAIADPGSSPATLNHSRGDRTPSEWSRDAVMTALVEGGWVLPGVPPVTQVLADARQFADELVLTKLVARIFRVMILGGVVIPETPQAMTWMRTYIDGDDRRHGPLGKPMVWPDSLPAICDLLRRWGFQPTPTRPAYVSLRPGGPLAPPAPDPTMPDPAMVVPVPELRERNMGVLLDETAGAPGVMAVDRMTAIRAMSAAFDRGTTHAADFGVFDPADGQWLWEANGDESTGFWGVRDYAGRWTYDEAVKIADALLEGYLIVAMPPREEGEEG